MFVYKQKCVQFFQTTQQLMNTCDVQTALCDTIRSIIHKIYVQKP
jgi:hypothetical protein